MFEWLQIITDSVVFNFVGLNPQSKAGLALNFFIYDTIKIFILLFIITFLMGIVNSYFPIERIRNFLSRNKLYGLEYFFASIFGAVTPFCSCSSVPLFIGFVKGGIPLGVTFAFLVTSPLINEAAVAIFIGTFGVKITVIYVISGILLGVTSGIVLGKLKLEYLLTDWVKKVWQDSEMENEKFRTEKLPFFRRVPYIINDAWGIIKNVAIYVVMGIAIGAGMHGYVPEGFFEQYIGRDTWYTIPLAVILGVPMYANAAGIIPVIQVFVAKGIPIGTSLSFMMAVVGLSIPEAILLKKVMTGRLIAIFFSVVTICIIISGYMFNLFF